MQAKWKAACEHEDGVKMSFAGDVGDNLLEVFEATGFGNDKLGLNGFVYHTEDKNYNGEWFCDYPSCPSIVSTDLDCSTVNFPKGKNEHIHPADEVKVAEERVIKRIKDLLIDDIKTTVSSAKMWQVVDMAMEEYKDDGGTEEMDRHAIHKRVVWWRTKTAIELGKKQPKVPKKQPAAKLEAKYPGDVGDNVLEKMMSYKGHHMISMNGYLYHIVDSSVHRSGTEMTWRCTVRGCFGKVKTDKEGLHGRAQDMHFHPPDHERVEKRRLDQKLSSHMAAGANEGKSSAEVISTFLAGLSEESISLLPRTSVLKRKYRRVLNSKI